MKKNNFEIASLEVICFGADVLTTSGDVIYTQRNDPENINPADNAVSDIQW